jgi:DNA-binding transcriptional regulator YdaS (Cro superfamily)
MPTAEITWDQLSLGTQSTSLSSAFFLVGVSNNLKQLMAVSYMIVGQSMMAMRLQVMPVRVSQECQDRVCALSGSGFVMREAAE